MTQQILRAVRVVSGVALVGGGAVLSMPFVPGPGFLLILGGLALLGQEFHWAHRLNVWLRRHGYRMLGRRHDRREGPDGGDAPEEGEGR